MNKWIEYIAVTALVANTLAMTMIIMQAWQAGWIIRMDFNTYNEGVTELAFVILTTPIALYYLYKKLTMIGWVGSG